MRIFLAEDNPMDRLLITRLLEKIEDFPHELVSSASANETIQLCRESHFDVILLDLHLTDSQGIETLTFIHQALPNLPIVVLTGSKESELAAIALRSGAQDYLVKRELSDTLMARVLKYAIERHRYRMELAQQDIHYLRILHQVPAVIWTTDCDLSITSTAGAPLCETLDQKNPDHLGKFVGDFLVGSPDLQLLIRSHEQALIGNNVSLEIEWLKRFFRIKLIPLNLGGQKITGVLGIAIDVSEQRELSVARLMQMSLRPASEPRIPGFDIYGASHAALETCGDWFDYLYWRDGAIGLVVGDLCGKGYGAAIMGTAVNSYLEAVVETQAEPAEIVTLCNRLFCKHSQESGFALLSLVRLHPAERTIDYVGAGEGMLIIAADGSLKHKLGASGIPLGISPHSEYEVPVTVPLETGDTLLLLTDGFREAGSREGEIFGEQRIAEMIGKLTTQSAQDIFEALRAACLEFGKGNGGFDDMTGIVVKVL